MCTMAINTEMNGIELSFETKPGVAIRDEMKQAGFRWHGQKKLWYARRTPDRLTLAARLSGTPLVSIAEPAPARETQISATAGAGIESRYGIKPGDILYDVWGYSMTIVSYYKVLRILSPCKIEIVAIGQKLIESDRGGGEQVVPDPNNELREKLVKTVTKDRRNDGKWYVKINSSVSLTPWDGRAHYQNTYD